MSEPNQFVRDALSGDAVRAHEAFNAMMRDRVAARVEELRQSAAATLFSAEEDVDVEDNNPES